jgi:hypothetical protein
MSIYSGNMQLRLILLAAASLALQGCVALALPALAAGAIGKTQVDAARARTKAAEAQVAALPKEEREALVIVAPVDEPAEAVTSVPAPPTPASGAMSGVERLVLSDINHPYLGLARYTLAQAQRRQDGQAVRSAVLIEQVSLIEPKAVDCGNKQLAVAIDMDAAPGETQIDGDPTGFGELLEILRESDIAIAWLSDRNIGALGNDLAKLRSGAIPALKQGDIELFAYPGVRKQERRWSLAASHCVVAIAGDRKSDFDELFDYLRDPDYAIRLEAWDNRGWFMLPHPAAVADQGNSPQDTEVEPTP